MEALLILCALTACMRAFIHTQCYMKLRSKSDKEIADEYFTRSSEVRQAQVQCVCACTITTQCHNIHVYYSCIICACVIVHVHPVPAYTLQLVVDWLEQNAQSNLEKYPDKVNYYADNVNWENTLHCLKNKINTDRIVSEMVCVISLSLSLSLSSLSLSFPSLSLPPPPPPPPDHFDMYAHTTQILHIHVHGNVRMHTHTHTHQDPDAPTREGRHLAELDEKDEQSLVRHLFTFIRAGQLPEAQELCVKCGQSWRAATLEGWKLHHDPNHGRGELL